MGLESKYNPSDYLKCREDYIIALRKYSNYGEELKRRLGVTTEAELEEAMLRERSNGRMTAEITHYATLGRQLDTASDVYDLATELQKRRVAQSVKQMDESIRRLEC